MVKNPLISFIENESGATAVEYGMFVALFSIGLIALWSGSEGGISANFSTASDTLDVTPESVDELTRKQGGD